jgi:competence protein ComFC
MGASPVGHGGVEVRLPELEVLREGVPEVAARPAVRSIERIGWLKSAAAALLSIVFPGPCRICEELLTEASFLPICRECRDTFPAIAERGSEESGPGEGTGAGGFARAESREFAFERAASWGFYEGTLVRAVLLLKFESIEPLGDLFAGMLADLARSWGIAGGIDLVVPVPLHREREKERGYNQAAVIAKPLAKRLGLPYKPVLLTRIRPRPDKHVLSMEERWESVRGAFATRPGSAVDNLRVLLVDDVLTTGATLDSCARTLRDAGAKSVVGLTVARARFGKAAEILPLQ